MHISRSSLLVVSFLLCFYIATLVQFLFFRATCISFHKEGFLGFNEVRNDGVTVASAGPRVRTDSSSDTDRGGGRSGWIWTEPDRRV